MRPGSFQLGHLSKHAHAVNNVNNIVLMQKRLIKTRVPVGPRLSRRVARPLVRRPRAAVGSDGPSSLPHVSSSAQHRVSRTHPDPSLLPFLPQQLVQSSETASDVPIVIPEDPLQVIPASSPGVQMLSQSGLVIVRQIEMLNIFLGFEQANKYAILSPDGTTLGYLMEEESSIVSTISRQMLRTHRPFKCTILGTEGNVIFRIRRPFQWINSRVTISVGDGPDEKIIGEAQQEWHPWRRRYNLYQKRGDDTYEQFARIDSPFLSWDFYAADAEGRVMASINRNFSGFARELFTDTGQYMLRFDAVQTEDLALAKASDNVDASTSTDLVPIHLGLTIDQRAILLATAMTCDIDYFSRHSSHGVGSSGFFPFMLPIPMGGSHEAPGNTDQDDGSGIGYSNSNDDEIGELPRSATADNAEAERRDTGYWDETPLEEGDTMEDPWAVGQEGATWNDLFGDDTGGGGGGSDGGGDGGGY